MVYPYKGIKRNQVLTHATTSMDLENMVLNKRNWARKATYFMPCRRNVQNRQIYIDTKSRLVVA